MAESKNCEVCGKEFHSKNIRFCGRICWIKKQTKWIKSVTNCEECGVEFEYKKPTTPRKRKSLRRYCSKECNTSTSFWINITPEQALNRLRFLFEKRVVKKDGCWEWIGSKTKKYPLIFFGIQGKAIAVNRASYLIHKGEIPDGLLVCHSCDNTRCTNPDHLFLGTSKDNTQDMIKKGRNAPILKGENASWSKLNSEKVKEIKELLKRGRTNISLSKEYNVSPSLISAIKTGIIWKE